LRMLLTFRGSDFYHSVQEAVERYTETPFFMETAEGAISGKIDLLFKEENGAWNLVDWKTEWVGDDPVGERGAAHFEQMRVYSRAVERFLGELPRIWLCFLNPRVILLPVETETDRLSNLT
jgi:ATP-dependent exoDNAse (exonuclease V) beta subunit